MGAWRLVAAVLSLWLTAVACAEPLTLPQDKRPEWLRRDGIVMAGSWEPLVFRVRRDGADYVPTPEQRAAWGREHSPEMVARLKALGVNFVMLHCYKGAGLEAERESMADAVRFSQLCHDAGLRVGVYNFSGAFLWEPFLRENPQAQTGSLATSKADPLPTELQDTATTGTAIIRRPKPSTARSSTFRSRTSRRTWFTSTTMWWGQAMIPSRSADFATTSARLFHWLVCHRWESPTSSLPNHPGSKPRRCWSARGRISAVARSPNRIGRWGSTPAPCDRMCSWSATPTGSVRRFTRP